MVEVLGTVVVVGLGTVVVEGARSAETAACCGRVGEARAIAKLDALVLPLAARKSS